MPTLSGLLMTGGFLGAVTVLIGWLWRHSARLTAAEIRIEGLTRRMDSHTLDVSAKLVRIEEKIDRMIEREIAK